VIGFVWTFCFKWPHSVSSLFFRRCELPRAQYVAVCARRDALDRDGSGEPSAADRAVFDHQRYIRRLRVCFSAVGKVIGAVLTGLFSDANTFGLSRSVDGVFEICRVRRDEDGTRYFMFMFRRYILEGDRFVPGQASVGTTLEDICGGVSAKAGLSSGAVADRRRVVGPNLVDMGKPSVVGTLWRQVSQPFYTWQMFFVWTVRMLYVLVAPSIDPSLHGPCRAGLPTP
jgi:hypothetical protein